MRILYRILFFIYALVALPAFFIKGKHREGFRERFGFVPSQSRQKMAGKKVIWLHAVSVGEAAVAMRFLEALRKEFPSAAYLITVTTPTAREIVRKQKNTNDTLLYLPADFKGAVRRFIRVVDPVVLILFETEIWPNLILELSDRKIPLFIVNGRISEKAHRSYRSIRFFIGPLLGRIRKIGAQDELMKRRFLEIGAQEGRVEVTGNLKYELRPDLASAAPWAENTKVFFGAKDTFIFIAGSTHEGEEELLLKMVGPISVSVPEFRMILAPRHPERVSSILDKARSLKVPALRISEVRGVSNGLAPVLILDKMGVLGGLYAQAQAVFLGGSLVPIGGHNPTEPAAFGKAVLFGPHMQNFKEMAEEFIRSDAAICVQNAQELKTRIEALAKDPQHRARLGAAAKELVERHEGALRKNLAMILTSLKGVLEP